MVQHRRFRKQFPYKRPRSPTLHSTFSSLLKYQQSDHVCLNLQAKEVTSRRENLAGKTLTTDHILPRAYCTDGNDEDFGGNPKKLAAVSRGTSIWARSGWPERPNVHRHHHHRRRRRRRAALHHLLRAFTLRRGPQARASAGHFFRFLPYGYVHACAAATVTLVCSLT